MDTPDDDDRTPRSPLSRIESVPAMNGTLYLVATPIGNYDDITFRAINVLKLADVVVYEERKEGNRLLAHYGIPEKVVESLNEHNEAAASFHILEHLKQGKNVALISDAGTPVFSDPGQIIVKKAIELNIRVVPIPGASSLMPALTEIGRASCRERVCLAV